MIPHNAARYSRGRVFKGDTRCIDRKGESAPFAEMYAARPAPAVAVERISLYSEATSIRKSGSSSHVARNASALGKSMRTSAASYGCNAIVLLTRGTTDANIDVAFLLCTNQAGKAKTGHKSFADALGQWRREAEPYRTSIFHRTSRIDALYREETRLIAATESINALSSTFS